MVLKAIDQDWQTVLNRVVIAFKKDWATRNNESADIIIKLLQTCLSMQLSQKINSDTEAEKCREKLFTKYSTRISRMEREALEKIRNLYKHNIFQYQLPPHSLLNTELFDERTWQLLGLTRQQVVIAGGLGGAAIGAGLEMATLGHSLGIFTAVGTAAGALGAFFGGESISDKTTFLGIPLGGKHIRIGPAKSIDMLFVLLNRSLLYYQHTINWAHGRRDYQTSDNKIAPTDSPQGFTKSWSAGKIKTCHDFFRIQRDQKEGNNQKTVDAFRQLLLKTMQDISEND